MNCPFGTYPHAPCGTWSECSRTDIHHHHLSSLGVEILSPGSQAECEETFGKGHES